MSEKPASDDFEDDGTDGLPEDADVDFDRINRDLSFARRRGQQLGAPAWRRLERIFEDRRTAELTSDFEDYDIGDDVSARRRRSSRLRGRRAPSPYRAMAAGS